MLDESPYVSDPSSATHLWYEIHRRCPTLGNAHVFWNSKVSSSFKDKEAKHFMGGARRTHGRLEGNMQNFSLKIWKEDVSWKIGVDVGGGGDIKTDLRETNYDSVDCIQLGLDRV